MPTPSNENINDREREAVARDASMGRVACLGSTDADALAGRIVGVSPKAGLPGDSKAGRIIGVSPDYLTDDLA